MGLFDRLQRRIGKRWYALMPTAKLLALVADQDRIGSAEVLIETLKERMAHQDGSFDELDWSSISLRGALLSSCRMKRVRLSTASLRGAYFGYSDLCSADFSLADLREASFREAKLNSAIFDGANLQHANFARACLAGSSFVSADLVNANFWGADLRGANLTDAILINCSLVDIVVDEKTTLPNGNSWTEGVNWG